MRNLLGLIVFSAAAVAQRIPIVVSVHASEAERTAASELASHLSRVYPAERFEVVSASPRAGRAILVGTPASSPEILRFVSKAKLAAPESFVVARGTRSGAPVGVIAGADARGVLYGVYALLEKLGWGFYLSYDAAPAVRKEPVDFAAWELSDAPVFADRVVFDWHNFLSSASTWEFEDWQRWIRGAAHMRFNTIMVHAYGNNPMFTFRNNGQAKPAGYLATTRKGRDWGTQHVNDIRRLVGGEIFHAPVFGSSAALVPDEERTFAAQELVRKAFAFARTYGLHVTFALDVDTESANPQNVVLTLPESARFRSGKLQLPNPDAPEGYAYWRAQGAQLLETYPQVDRLVVWFRANATPWRNIKPDEFPAAWKVQYQASLEKDPRLRSDKDAASMFAIARIAAAFRRALDELGRKDVELGAGTWRYAHLPAADAFFAPAVKLYWLDWATVFDQPEVQAALRSIRRERPMLPVVWAHHDDRTYVGRPYTPFAQFASLVEGTGTGFGIIHWTTRPLDNYFKSLSEQVWQTTRNRALAETAREMAGRSFGPSAESAGGEYLVKWVTEGRMFGRETTDRFIDVLLKDSAEVIAQCRERLALLARIDENMLPAEGRERLHYYRDYEAFVAEFFRSHAAFERAQELYKRGDIDKARAAIAECDPQRAIERYAAAASHGGMTRGEQALLISLNLRWRPYIVSLRQALGLDAALFKFQPTQHEPLAQGAGSNSFWLDGQRVPWKAQGEKETGAPAVGDATSDETCGSGIRIDRPLTLRFSGIMGDRFAPGRYRTQLLFAETGPGRGTSAVVEMRGGGSEPVVVQADLRPGRDLRTTANIEITAGTLEVTIRPSDGPVIACAAIVVPEPAHP